MAINRVVLLVLDSCGCGDAPDADAYGDRGANTLVNTARYAGPLSLPNMETLGLGRIAPIAGVSEAAEPTAAYGRMQEQSAGKDTTSGHWEIAGLISKTPFRTFPHGFPEELIAAFERRTGRGVLGNRTASGTVIIEELGQQHLASGDWIVYTSADSVFQVAAHEEVVPLDELYSACEIARELVDPLHVGRVIARPFIGTHGAFERTYHRRDFGMPPPAPTLLDALAESSVETIGVGKISDIFSGRGLSESIHTEGNADGLKKTADRLAVLDRGFVFVNLIDFDSLYGHRRDPRGFAAALTEFDRYLPEITQQISDQDVLVVTADHGNDPTFTGTDHTREQVPLLVYGPQTAAGKKLGVRSTFADIAATVAEVFGASWDGAGTSFWGEIQ